MYAFPESSFRFGQCVRFEICLSRESQESVSYGSFVYASVKYDYFIASVLM